MKKRILGSRAVNQVPDYDFKDNFYKANEVHEVFLHKNEIYSMHQSLDLVENSKRNNQRQTRVQVPALFFT